MAGNAWIAPLWLCLLSVAFTLAPPDARHVADEPKLFQPATACIACHNGLVTPAGTDVSFAAEWRATMMANSARDPYWQASVRREVMDHPSAQAGIEDACSTCHMPMTRYESRANGRPGTVFDHLSGNSSSELGALAMDGVSCTLCHQITSDRLGTTASFDGGFVIDTIAPWDRRVVFGPFDIDSGRTTIMRSATGMRPVRADHIRSSEMCATCHTLFTKALDSQGRVIGELPEQVPFLEWRNSSFAGTASCQSCHMPVIRDSVAITGVLGQPRTGAARHTFRGGNYFTLRMLNRYRTDLGVTATPLELDAAADATVRELATSAAQVGIANINMNGGVLNADIILTNLAGHKLPTAYPSRRVWLHITVRDARDAVVFESGSMRADGSITGNDNDADGLRYEPHHTVIERADQVQIYESVMADAAGRVTTGLLSAVRFVKDNRVLPAGFDKVGASDDIAVRGDALADADFTAGGDRTRLSIPVTGQAPYRVDVEVRYQPIAFRWAHNLGTRPSPETDRFVSYYRSMAQLSSTVLATAREVVR